MNNGLLTYLAALLLFGSNGIIAAAIALPSSDIVLLRTFLGALSLVVILVITQRHNLQAPSRPREAAALILSGAALGAQLDFPVPRLPDHWRRHFLTAVLLRPHHRYGALPTHLWRKTDRAAKSPGLSPSPAAPSSSRHKVWAAICPLRVSLAASSRPSATH